MEHRTLFRTALCLSSLLTTSLWNVAIARDEFAGVKACLAITTDSERLTCYDREVRKLHKPDYAGRLNFVTPVFDITKPTNLRFESDGVIFVLYLKTEDDQVVQNLHIGGGGEETYVIERPGRYFMQINGSEGWRIWLEPLTAKSN